MACLAPLPATFSSARLNPSHKPFHPRCLHQASRLWRPSNHSSTRLRHSHTRRISKIFCRVGNSVLPSKSRDNSTDLQEEFGCEGLQFSDIDGMTVIEMKLSNGTSARILLQAARITSYKFLMWHGGLEEMLHADVSQEVTHGKFSVTGGIFLSFFNEETKLPFLEENWHVDDVQVDPSNMVQVTLRYMGSKTGQKTEDSWLCLQYIITLSIDGLVSAVVVSNIGQLPITFTCSVDTAVAASTIGAVSATGLQGCKFCCAASKSSNKAIFRENENQGGGFLLRNLTEGFLSNQKVKSDKQDNTRNTRLIAEDTNGISSKQCSINRELDRSKWLTQEDPVLFKSGMFKVYAMPPRKVRILDMGFRRSLVFERIGFVDVILHCPDLVSELADEAACVCVGSATALDPVSLSHGQMWRAAQVLIPDF